MSDIVENAINSQCLVISNSIISYHINFGNSINIKTVHSWEARHVKNNYFGQERILIVNRYLKRKA